MSGRKTGPNPLVFLYFSCHSEASDRCQAEKRKTINGEDILFAMSTLGFDNYVEPLKLYLQKYREAMKGDKHTEGFEDINEVLRKYKENRRHVSQKYRDFYITAILKLLFALTAFRRFSNDPRLCFTNKRVCN